MFFIMGIDEGKKDLGVSMSMICPCCGMRGRLQIVVTYTVLSLFFIPTFKWNRQYYVRFDCCNSVFALDPEIGRALERGREAEISSGHLTLLQDGRQEGRSKRCPVCGFPAEEEFEFCPKCRNRLV